MKKTPICLLIVLALTLATVFSSCGGRDPAPTTAASATAASAAASEPTTRTAQTTPATPATPAGPTKTETPSGGTETKSETVLPPDDLFETRTVNAFYLDESLNTTVELRYYGAIPYLSIEEYLALLYRGREIPEGRDAVEVVREGATYTVTTASGTPAILDVEKNTLETENFSLFKNTHFTEKGIEGCISYDAMPFIQVKSVTVDREALPMKIDFGAYGLKIHGDEHTVFLPVPTLADLFSCQNILVGAFNGKDLYFYYFTENEQISQFGARFFEELFTVARTQEGADYNYGEFCLNYDLFLGRSGRSALERYYDLSSGIDAALGSDETGRAVRKLLRSVDPVEYLAGLYVFHLLFSDGGHSGCDPLSSTYYLDGSARRPSWMTSQFTDAVLDLAAGIIAGGAPALTDVCAAVRRHSDVYAARRDALGKPASALAGTQTYTRVGDTAFIHIDGFMNELLQADAWKDYYQGVTDEIPFGGEVGGAVGATYFGLQKAKEDGVRRVIVDLSANTGGSTDEMLYMISLLTGHSELCLRDRATGQVYTVEYRVDRNLDRVFDEKDDAFDPTNGLQIAVLTSRNGFSCGGISPILLHEYGIPTLGEDCGGGSCAIYFQHDLYGFLRRASCPIQICTPSGVDIDTARIGCCDVPLEITVNPDTGQIDYRGFFDVERLAAR